MRGSEAAPASCGRGGRRGAHNRRSTAGRARQAASRVPARGRWYLDGLEDETLVQSLVWTLHICRLSRDDNDPKEAR
jgi:hypothetical protein